ncbi:Pentatricopeptide repeat-containing protein, partial [Thalictrum thalictroides]
MLERYRITKLLKICSRQLLLKQGFQIHATATKMGFSVDLIMNNDLIDMYAKCRMITMAHLVFDNMPERNVVSWTALMTGYLSQGNAMASLSLFCKMGYSGIKPNEFTFSTSLKACIVVGIPENGTQVHLFCAKTGFESMPVVGNSIIDMYSKFGKVEEAIRHFDQMPYKNLITWNVMIAGHAHEGYGKKSLSLFPRMQEQGEIPDEYTFVSLLKACSGHGAICEGRQIHASLVTRGFQISGMTILASALVDFYVKCRCMSEAWHIFNHIVQKNVICWTAIIVGCSQEGNIHDAMELFKQIRKTEIQVDSFILSTMISIFADFSLMEQGKQIHSYTIKVPSGLDLSVANSLIDMYLKCGLTEEAKRRFHEISNPSVVSWTVMITGYGKHGHGSGAIHLFEQMQLEGIDPDDVTYLAVLSACSHAGLTEEGCKFFSRLCKDHKVRPKIEHYACMVDLLGRAGRLEEAKNLIENIPVKPNAGIWQTLLGACRVHRDLKLGTEVGETLLSLDGENPVNYVMLSNIYAEAGEWKDYERIREVMKCKGLKKEAGCSWIEINKKVHYFYGGDNNHPLTERIHEMLKDMERRMKEETGYVYRVRYALHDVEEESKEDSLRVHSEKLAIGLGLVCGGLDKGGDGVCSFNQNFIVCLKKHHKCKGVVLLQYGAQVVRSKFIFHQFKQ